MTTQMVPISCCVVCGSERYSPFFEENGFALVRCCRCGLIYCDHRPATTDVRAMYEDERWLSGDGAVVLDDSQYTGADETRELEARGHLCHALGHVSPPGRLLDVGAGAGHLVAAAIAAGFSAEGVELSRARVLTARARGLEMHHGELAELAIATSSFDVVITINVLSHVTDPPEFLSELARITRPGGTLYLVTGNKAELERYADGTRLGDFWGAPGHLFFFGEPQLRALLAKAGFRVEAVERVSRLASRLEPARLGWPGRWALVRGALARMPPVRAAATWWYRHLVYGGRPLSGNLRVTARRLDAATQQSSAVSWHDSVSPGGSAAEK